MLIRIPENTQWINHLESRLSAARDIGLLNKYVEIEQDRAVLFLPVKAENFRSASFHPEFSLRSILSHGDIPKNDWVLRKDMMAEAAQWVKKYSAGFSSTWLFTEAGWSEPGDKSLEKDNYIVCNSRPVYYLNIHLTEKERIKLILRKSRSSRFLGVLTPSMNEPDEILPAADGYFLTDALQGDSLILVPVRPGLSS